MKFEDMPGDRQYDLVLFSESFQYIRPEASMAQSSRLVMQDGHVLICDAFKRDGVEGKCKIGGGHRLTKFQGALSQSRFQIVRDIDITQRVAPTIDLEADVFKQVVGPLYESIYGYLLSRHPLVTRFLLWCFRNRIAKIGRKYFEGDRDGRHFARYKCYRLILLRHAIAP